MKAMIDENQLQDLFYNVRLSPGERFYRHMRQAAWTPAGVARRRATLIAVLAIFTATILVFTSPKGLAWAQEVFQFFRKAPSDTLPLQGFQMTSIASSQLTTTPVNVTMTPGFDPGFTFDLTVDEAGQRAGFSVLLPTSVPSALTFIGASYEPDHGIVRLYYRHTDYPDIRNGLILREELYQTNDNCDLCGVVGASQAIEPVTIGNVTGEYVEGVWTLTDHGPVWEGTPFLKTLRWRMNGRAFELQYMGIPDSVMAVDKDQLIAIAESVR
jgi:hypothetical protein